MTPGVQKYTGDLDKSNSRDGQSKRAGRKRKKGDSFEKSDGVTELWAENKAESQRAPRVDRILWIFLALFEQGFLYFRERNKETKI